MVQILIAAILVLAAFKVLGRNDNSSVEFHIALAFVLIPALSAWLLGLVSIAVPFMLPWVPFIALFLYFAFPFYVLRWVMELSLKKSVLLALIVLACMIISELGTTYIVGLIVEA